MYKSEIILPVFQNHPGEYELHYKAKADTLKKAPDHHTKRKKIIKGYQTPSTKLYIDTFKGIVLLTGAAEPDKSNKIAGEAAKLVIGIAPIKNVLATKKANAF